MSWLEKGYQERFNPGVLLRPGLIPSAPTRGSKTCCAALRSSSKSVSSGET